MPRVEAEVGSAANSYEILAKLATGGMAEIFLARGSGAAGVERYVVLKRILRHRASDQSFVRMFLDEARLASQLQHPNIAQVYDIGKLGDSYFFTMEYVHGETVRALLQRSHALRSPIPIQSVLVIAAGSAAGLHHAHERNGFDGKPLGIVHRDVSPSNLMVSYEGAVKVVDFGVAKAAHRSQETRSGTVKGKISYLSPEQCRGGQVDRRSDLFSLGIVLWEMLTTERLYKRATDFEAMAAIVSEDVPLPSSRRSDIPPELDAIVLKLLAKDATNRFQSADEVHEAIENLAVRLGFALSSTGFARYLRDLFGQRPEPWIEMQSRETHPEAFTVTSEPIPADLGIRPADELDHKLGAVPDLSNAQESADDNDLPPRPASEGFPTVPFRLSDSDSSGAARPVFQVAPPPTTNLRVPQGPTTLPYMPRADAAPTLIQNDRSRPNPIPNPLAVASTAPSASYPSIANYPSYAAKPPEPAPVAPRRTPRFVIVLVAAIAIGIVLGIVFAVTSGGDNSVATTRGDAAVPIATLQPDAIERASPPPAAPDAATVAVVAPIDAAVVEAVAIDAGTKPPKPPRHDPPRRDPDPSPADDLAKAIAASRFGDAVATCTANPALIGSSVSMCVNAACRVRDAAKAKKWIAVAGAKKGAALTAACKAAGLNLEPAPTTTTTTTTTTTKKDSDCIADPMACQH